MPAYLSKEDKLQRLVDNTRKRVDKKPETARSLSGLAR
jgi:hypothetical protein